MTFRLRRAVRICIVCLIIASALAPLSVLLRIHVARINLGRFGDSAHFDVFGRLVGMGPTFFPIRDSDLERLGSYTHLESLWLTHGEVSDDGMLHIQKLAGLRELVLTGTPVTDVGVERIASLSRLEHLALPYFASDASLRLVAEMSSLKKLEVDGVTISEEGLSYLAGTPIEFLSMGHCKLSESGIISCNTCAYI